uniref:Ribosomal protein S11 n=1 Tax=Proteomonas sulcata TaxID=77928 RepID=A0A2P1G8C4_9CRYP|nr:ribosomal protein S11 [Proteomonas sulcata]AVM81215.1 ribosomal protein S11 [Proteomonas sulcata]
MSAKITNISNLIKPAIFHVNSTFNNTLIVISDLKGNILFSGSGGTIGLKGSKRSTGFASQNTANLLSKKAYKAGIRSVYVLVKGFGNGRELCLRGITMAKLKIINIKDITPIPHNGCRVRKKRRV